MENNVNYIQKLLSLDMYVFTEITFDFLNCGQLQD